MHGIGSERSLFHMLEYPSRPKVFAMKFIRQLIKTCAATDVGQLGFSLLSTIVATEDASGYSRPVTFYDSQLMMILNVENQKQLASARNKAVAAGWLQYQHGSKRVPGKYFVTIPAHVNTDDDAPSDEGCDDIGNESGTKKEQIGNESGTDRERNGNEMGTNLAPFFPVPIPVPKNLNNTHEEAKKEIQTGMLRRSEGFSRFMEAYPRPSAPEAAWVEWQGKVYTEAMRHGKPDAEIEEMIVSAAQEFRDSPAGKPPDGSQDYRPAAAKWLQGNCWEEPRELWQQPNGKATTKSRQPPKPKIRPLEVDQKIGQQLQDLMK